MDKELMDTLKYIVDNMATKDDIGRLDARMGDVESGLSKLEATIDHKITKRLDSLTDGYKSVHEKQWELERQNEQLASVVSDLQNRVAALENQSA